MKEATGELSTTMIAVVAIAAVLTIFTTLLLPYLKSSIQSRMHCADAICDCSAGEKTCSCSYYDDSGNLVDGITCSNPDWSND